MEATRSVRFRTARTELEICSQGLFCRSGTNHYLQLLEEMYWEGKYCTCLASSPTVSLPVANPCSLCSGRAECSLWLSCFSTDSSLVFSYPARHIVKVDGKRGLFRGLTPRLISSTLSTITRGSVKKVKVGFSLHKSACRGSQCYCSRATEAAHACNQP